MNLTKTSFLTFILLTCIFRISTGQDISYNFNVLRYDLFYEIDTDKKVFKSHQDILIKNSTSTRFDQLNFLLHPDLIVDKIIIEDTWNKNIPVLKSEQIGMTKIFKNELQVINVEMGENLMSGQTYFFHLDFHLQTDAFKDSAQIPGNNLDLFISKELCFAVGPTTGHFALFNKNIMAPFNLKIKFPGDRLCCVPGDNILTEKDGSFIIENYISQTPAIPAFSCAFYEKKTRITDGTKIEYYLYPGQNFVEEMFDYPDRFIQYYTTTFGGIGTHIYKFANIGAIDSKILSLENKGNVVYLSDLLTRYYSYDEGIKNMFIGLISHELFHNWNIFSVNWNGELTDWFEEGGANFFAAWAGEKIVGEEFGISGRYHFNSAFSGETGSPGFEAHETLESVSKNNSGDPELILIYYYGAFVWEQLRQMMGDENLLEGMNDFFIHNKYKTVHYQDLLQCLQSKTNINLEKYLNQWIKHNAKIDLFIDEVIINETKNGYSNKVEIMIDSDRDYELFTTLIYKTSTNEEMKYINVHTKTKGKHIIKFQSQADPVFIQIDPKIVVPQINLDNNIWSKI